MKTFWKLWSVLVLTALGWTGPVAAQETSYLQIEAQPSLDKAMERARIWSQDFSDLQGFRLGSGWYGLVLGPMSEEDAGNRLLALRQQNAIPYDSFLTSAADLGQRFWPAGAEDAGAGDTAGDAAGDAAAIQMPAAEAPASAAPASPDPVMIEETPEEALAAESMLSQTERAALQEALKWYGFYDGALDGAIGKGSRKSMAAWQEAKGYDPTGILTTIQRAELMGAFAQDKAEFGYDTVTDAESGIEVTLPLGLVEFDSYAPPFVLFRDKAGSGLTIRLISEPGDGAALSGLYDVLQGLDIMPANGPRSLGEDSFTIRGDAADRSALAYARSEKGAVKGYLISWTPALADRIDRILPVIEGSFRFAGAKALDPGLVPLDEAVRRGLMAGLAAKAPKSSQSGLFVSPDGAVVTTAAAVAGCARVTIERQTEAEIAAQDAARGLVLLKPRGVIAPQSFARFAPALPAAGAAVAAVGWSYGDRLPAPVMNPGLLESTSGLDGSADQIQLTLDVLPGDAGGPVLDATGAVIGLVLNGPAKGPALPQGVALAETGTAIAALMAGAQIAPTMAPGGAPATPDALQAAGLGMTALISCWE